ncbi:MAG TPA: RDD family protein [Silvibacterium sp.]|nr:RDD family protein [Silvibacterium sp.]
MSTSPQSAVYEETSSTPAWKQEVNARLVAHRTRRTRNLANPEDQPALPGLEGATLSRSEAARATRVAARVAERYSKAPSYSEMLAAETAARAAAPPVADVLWAEPDVPAAESEAQAQIPEAIPECPPAPERIQYRIDPGSLPEPRRAILRQAVPEPVRHPVAEIVDPFEDAVIAPAQPLPVRILEFPRELIAARKARPRHAEGPLRASQSEPEKSQLRIFEVESEAISHEAGSREPIEEQVLPEWHSIRLDAKPREDNPVPARFNQHHTRQMENRAERESGDRPPQQGSQPAGAAQPGKQRSQDNAEQPDSPQSRSSFFDLFPLHVASIEDRLMAGIVDLALVLIAFLLFVLVFVACTAHPPAGKPALIVGGIALVSFFLLYQWLFFTYADSTPGMRYARIALCTFDDENPSRKALQWRIAALFLSAMPLGLGFLWALLDDERLGWHDRITRTYQRSYK